MRIISALLQLKPLSWYTHLPLNFPLSRVNVFFNFSNNVFDGNLFHESWEWVTDRRQEQNNNKLLLRIHVRPDDKWAGSISCDNTVPKPRENQTLDTGKQAVRSRTIIQKNK